MNRSFLVVVFSLLFQSFVYSQQSLPCDSSKDVRIEKNKPTVYLTFERFGKAVYPLETRLAEPSNTKKSEEKGNDVWLRLHNNTCWAIQLETLSSYLPKEKKPNEKAIEYLMRGFYLEENAEIAIDYEIQERDGKILTSPIDMYSISQIPSGVSVIFSVAHKHLSIPKERSIFVKYNYAWEIREKSNTAYDEPQHRVEYRSYELENELKK